MKKILALTIIAVIALSVTAFGALLMDFSSQSHEFVIQADPLTDLLDEQRDLQRFSLIYDK